VLQRLPLGYIHLWKDIETILLSDHSEKKEKDINVTYSLPLDQNGKDRSNHPSTENVKTGSK